MLHVWPLVQDLLSEGDFMGRLVIDSWAAVRALQAATAEKLAKDRRPFEHFEGDRSKKDEVATTPKNQPVFT